MVCSSRYKSCLNIESFSLLRELCIYLLSVNPEGSPAGPLGAAGFACFLVIWSGFHSFYL